MCILERVGEKRVQTVFMATEKGFRRVWYPITHHLKYKGDEMNAQGLQLEIHSASGDTRARKWFASLGFTYCDTQGAVSNYLKQGG
jgi:hypothetical protein